MGNNSHIDHDSAKHKSPTEQFLELLLDLWDRHQASGESSLPAADLEHLVKHGETDEQLWHRLAKQRGYTPLRMP
jgi:hypothetical protein